MAGPCVAVIGAGAIGGLLASGLARAGAQVTLWGRAGALARLPEVRLSDGSVWPEVDTAPARCKPQAIVLAVKSVDMAGALERARQLVTGVPVIPVVNGVPFWLLPRLAHPKLPSQLRTVDPDGQITRLATGMPILGSVIYVAAERKNGIVISDSGAKLFIEAGGGPAVEALCDALGGASILIERPADLLPVMFDKLMGNAVMNPLTALTGLSLGAAAAALGPQVRRGMAEVLAIARAMGIELEGDLDKRVQRIAGARSHTTSMLQDVQAKRQTEIDAITGAMNELGDALEVDTPLLSILHGLVSALDAQRRPARERIPDPRRIRE